MVIDNGGDNDIMTILVRMMVMMMMMMVVVMMVVIDNGGDNGGEGWWCDVAGYDGHSDIMCSFLSFHYFSTVLVEPFCTASITESGDIRIQVFKCDKF